ncbi:MAG TPA: hypothetical protein VFN74_20925 [Chloroflexota bacterium]|nr:hypothetical protein [Chloroflexota bacterium]
MAEQNQELRFLVADLRRDELAPIWLYQLITWESELRGGRHRRTRAERPPKSPEGASVGHQTSCPAA